MTEQNIYPPSSPDDEETERAAERARRRRRCGGRLFWLVVLVIAAALTLSWQRWLPLVAPLLERPVPSAQQATPSPSEKAETTATEESGRPSLDETRLTRLEGRGQALERMLVSMTERLAELDSRLDRLENALAALEESTPPATNLSEVENRLEAMEKALAAGGRGSGGAVSAGRLAKAEARVEALEEQIASLADDIAALRESAGRSAASLHHEGFALALSQLKARILEGRSYLAELNSLTRLSAGDSRLAEPLKALRVYAERGVPTVADLRETFEHEAPDILAAAREEQAEAGEAGWLDRTLARLKALVTVRRVGNIAGPSTEAIIARAEAALGRGDLGRAMKEVEALKGAAAVTAEDWVDRARTRFEVDRLLAELDSILLSASSGEPAGTVPRSAPPAAP